MMKKHSLLLLLLISALSMAACGSREATFEAVVLGVSAEDHWCMVEPVEGSQELDSADRIEINLYNDLPATVAYDIAHEAKVGDTVEITYNGEIMETYPAQLGDVYNIKIVETAEE